MCAAAVEPSAMGQSRGDLIIITHIAPHPFFTRVDQDVLLELPISFAEALKGAGASVPTLDGPVEFDIPPGVNSGKKLRIKGRGIENRDHTKGDQLCRLLIVLPEGLCEQEIESLVNVNATSIRSAEGRVVEHLKLLYSFGHSSSSMSQSLSFLSSVFCPFIFADAAKPATTMPTGLLHELPALLTIVILAALLFVLMLIVMSLIIVARRLVMTSLEPQTKENPLYRRWKIAGQRLQSDEPQPPKDSKQN